MNDLARSISQDGKTQTFDLDPMLRMSVKTTTSAGPTSTESYAYTGDSDSPAFTQNGAAWNRTVAGIAGNDAVQDSATGISLQIQNLRGDIVAQSTTAGVLSNYSRVDEFGVPKTALPPGTKYAYHGSKQREALTSGGVIAMGVRLYQPQMGRFLQVDPVLGGTANSYEYPSGPVNSQDLDGKRKARVRLTLGKERTKKLVRHLRAEARRLRDLAKTDDAIASAGVAAAFTTEGLTLVPAGVAFFVARKRDAKATYFENLADNIQDMLDASGGKGINIVTRFNKGLKNVSVRYYQAGPKDKAGTWSVTDFDGKYSKGP